MGNINKGTAIRFLLVGGASTLFQYALMFAFIYFGVLSKVTASAVSFAISAVFNYLFNARLTFASGNRHSHGLPRFAATATAGCAINTAVLDVLLFLGAPLVLAQICATGVVLIWNYVINAVWTFRPQQ